MRIAVVMTHYERFEQLRNTVKSLNKNVKIFIVDDCSPTENLITALLCDYRIYGQVILPQKKTWTNPCVPFNMGFEAALEDAEIIIIQNAECYHAGDIIGYVEKHLTNENYLSFGCYSLPKDSEIPPKEINQKGASFDGESAWYNHSIHRPVGYHFCSAITAENLRKINGFDERFAYGVGYDDLYFLHQIKNLGLRIEIVDDPFVFHQWHYSNKNNEPFLIKKNYDLWNELSQTKDFRAKHIITPDLDFSL